MLFVSGMEVDDSSSSPPSLSPRDRVLLRLNKCGVPKEQLDQLQLGLVAFVKENKDKLSDIVYAILPTEDDAVEALAEAKPDTEEEEEEEESSSNPALEKLYRESIQWLRWLMFEEEPDECLNSLAKRSVGQRGVCGAVWGHNDIAYRCKTCEHDPTCAICVTCFQNGNHKDHDYSLMYTGGGCCDCGDETAWKREGFCSKHKGAEQIQPLPEEIACSVGPVLDVLFSYWEEKLLIAQAAHLGNILNGDRDDGHVKVENELTSAVVEMLLEFCKHSESLLSFVSRRMFLLDLLLDVLVRAERFLNKEVTKKLHELLLKFLGDPLFKYDFAKIFISYYPETIKEAIKEGSDSVMDRYRLVSTFSVQIFTVPTLTPRLVKEMNLLGRLFGCLEDLLHSCAGEEGPLQVSKWAGLYETTIRLVEDTRYVVSHVEVSKYVVHEQPDITKTWLRLLAYVQGMNPQKRVTGLHVEEENENMHIPFVLGHSIANIHTILVNEAFSVEEMKDDSTSQVLDDGDSPLRHTKVGRLSQQSSVCSTTGRSTSLGGASQVAEENIGDVSGVSLPPTVTWLTGECLRAIENWLGCNAVSKDNLSSLSEDISSQAVGFLAWKKTLSKIRKAKSISKVYRSPSARGRFGTSSELHGRRGPLPFSSGSGLSDILDYSLVGTNDMDNRECACTAEGSSDSVVESECSTESEAWGLLSLSDWPDIVYDASKEDISVHIPLHRLLSVLLHKALKKCYGDTGALEMSSCGSASPSLSVHFRDFFGQVLRGCHPFGFSAYVMEHPLRIKVFCAEVRAGMWRKNGDVAPLSCEWYRSVRWSEQGLELDIFLLQCCAALAPPDPFVKRILERFGLSNYLSLDLKQSNEYEPVLVQEMLTLIIQIIKERRFCGLSTAESLRRELVYKLAIGDATRSQLVKSLPQDLSKNDQLQVILDSVADYSNPSGMKQGKYSLRKTCWEELDLYHPRWNSRDLQVAEERYLRFCKVSALAAQLPRWTNAFYPLNGISRIATSRALMEIVRAVLFYAVFTDKPSKSRAPDGVVLIALHLLSLGLDICSLQRQTSDQSSTNLSYVLEGYPIPLLAFATEEIPAGATNGYDAVKRKSLLSLLVLLMRMHKKDTFEAGQCNLSYLVASLLKKLAELNVVCMIELQRLAPELVSHLMHPIPNTDVQKSAPISDADERKLKARERQAAIMEKMRAAQSKFMASLKPDENEDVDVSKSKKQLRNSDTRIHVSEEMAPAVCSLCRDPDSKSPLSFLILLQKSRLASFVERGLLSWEQAHSSDNDRSSSKTDEVTDAYGRNIPPSNSGAISDSHLVQLVQNAVNEFSHDGLPGEVDAVLDFIKTQLPVARNVEWPSTADDTSMDTSSSIGMMEVDIYQAIQKDMQDTVEHSIVIEGDHKFSIEHDEEGITTNRYAESTLLGKYIASISRETSEHPLVSKNSRGENASSNTSVHVSAFDGFGPTDCNGIHVSSCGHAVHQECRNRYLSSLRERYIRRIIFEGGHVVDPDQGEFLCPVCRRLANSVLPACSNNSSKVGIQMMPSDFSLVPTIGSSITSQTNVLRLAQALSFLQSAGNMVGKSKMHKTLTSHCGKKIQPTLEPVFNILSRMYFPNRHEKLLASGRVSQSILLWDTLKYSLISTEIAARGGRSNMSAGSSTSGLEALYRELDSSSGFILSLLLQVVQNTRSENALQVLLRFRGIQLFAQSICYGVSADEISPDAGYQKGNISSVLKHIDKGVVYPDIQFWRRAADPVLAHDPFSSLMWILFSLPSPFLSSVECFLYLVHLFYAVCVIQAIITYIGKYQFDITEFGDSLVSDCYKIVGEYGFTRQYFVSNYIDDASCHPKDMIRRLSHPYLRRCALLWKLLRSSAPAPFSDRSHERIRLSLNLENPTALSVELLEVEELEHMFQVPNLDVIVKDNMIRSLGLKWFHHFSREYGTRNYGCTLHTTPAIPFRLIRLPHVYQDLLERYIKKKCPECGAVQDEPALCLLCGRICSPSWKQCCGENECKTHAMSCGAGIGVYLLIRRTTILLQRSARQAPWPSPYLDAFGEEDTEMHRGKPLYLNEERYAALTNMVASHGLDRSSEVLRQTTIDALFVI